MVCDWGMSDLGPISFGQADESIPGRDFARTRDFSEETASAVDREVHRFIDEAYRDARALLEKHRPVLDALSDALYERETLDADEIDAIIEQVGGPGLLPPKPEKKDRPSSPPPIDMAPSATPAKEPGGFPIPPGIAPDPA
jgi:cell division protease FtsH